MIIRVKPGPVGCSRIYHEEISGSPDGRKWAYRLPEPKAVSGAKTISQSPPRCTIGVKGILKE
jgi:hypothetical protein